MEASSYIELVLGIDTRTCDRLDHMERMTNAPNSRYAHLAPGRARGSFLRQNRPHPPLSREDQR